MVNLVEVVEKQSSIISIQSEVITDLFSLLSQHLTPDELDSLPEFAKINSAAEIVQDIERL